MKSWKHIVHSICYPHSAIAILSLPLAVLLQLYALVKPALAIELRVGIYLFFPYSLLIFFLRLPMLQGELQRLAQKNQFLQQYISDLGLRIRLSLLTLFSSNSLYALVLLVLGFVHRDAWSFALSGYYCLLALMRFFLLRKSRTELGENLLDEYRRFRLCGIVLLLMSLALGRIVLLMAQRNRAVEHPVIVSVLMAAYAFVIFINAMIHLLRCRRSKSPVIQAAKLLSFVTALVSALSVQTVMIGSFGKGNTSAYNRMLILLNGALVCGIVLLLALRMIVAAQKQLRKIRE